MTLREDAPIVRPARIESPSPPREASPEVAWFDAAPVALLHVDPDGVQRSANVAARALLGAAAEPGWRFQSLWPASEGAAALCDPGMKTGSVAEAELVPVGAPWAILKARSSRLASGGWVLSMQPAATAEADPCGVTAMHALAVELGDIVVWRHDLRTHRFSFNAQGYRIFGIDPRPDGMSEAEVRALVHPDDLPALQESARAALQSDRPTDTEVRQRHSDGSWRHVMTRRVAQRGPDGQVMGFVGIALDVSERAGQLRRNQDLVRRFELAARTAGIGYWQIEDGAAGIGWSTELHRLLGLPAGEAVPALAECLDRFVHPGDRATVRRDIAKWLLGDGESLVQTLRIVRTDRAVRHIVSHARKESVAGGQGFFGVVIDFTDRREAEQALRSAAESAALAARGAGVATWEHDLSAGALRWDPQMWVLRGHAARPGTMSDEQRLACVHPEDRALLVERVSQSIADRTPLDHEYRVVWPDGSVHWLASRAQELSDEISGRRRRIGVNWDVTASRNAEAERQASEVARRDSQAKSKFLARMSHELRTPLNAVLGFSQLLLADERGDDETSASRRRRLEHVRGAGDHLLTLINDMLELSSLEGGERRITLRAVPLPTLVSAVLPLLAPLCGAHGVELHTGEIAASVMADAKRLRQVLINLLSNAIKYNRAGGEVFIEALLERSEAGAQVCLRVADTGPGMSELQLAQIFEPFNRLGRENNESTEGTGIGLAIVKTLVEHMNGSIRVLSTEGAGSVFEVRLGAGPETAEPAAAETRPAQLRSLPTPPIDATPSLPPRRVLYIEDNPVNAMIIAELLGRRSDLLLEIAVDGGSGLAEAAACPPDLVLLDMQLPDMDGFEVLRRLRALPATAGIPCIALSANAMPEDIRRARQAGMADYWTKPLDFKAFLAALDTYLVRR